MNRIAAGEVVLRPSAALKELLENSLDAGARNITVCVRGGGMKLLRVTDDGHGISAEDLPLLCHRFATSKLRAFEDLRTVATFGFRGEALASVSHVARVSVLTKVADARLGFSASYLDGALRQDPRPTAAVQGTSLSVEDLFYNLPTRRNALRATGEEYRAIVDVVARYAIRYPKVAFVCKKLNEKGSASQRPDVRTLPDASAKENIRAAFGAFVAQELLSVDTEMEEKGVRVESLVTKASFNLKKRIFVLFINGRLVECGPLKRAIDSAYAGFLPKGSHPFAYVSVTMRQEDVDVNVHPTKKEVRFLHETEIIDAYIAALLENLTKSESSRTFLAQTVLGSTGRNGSMGIMKTKKCTQDGNDKDDDDDDDDDEPELEEDDVEMKPEKPLPRSRFLDLEAGVGTERSNDNTNTANNPSPRHGPRSSVPRTLNETVSEFDTVDPNATENESESERPSSSRPSSSRPPSSMKKQKLAPQFMVRTGPSTPAGILDSYFTPTGKPSPAVGLSKWRKRRNNALPLLTSVRDEIESLRKGCHQKINEIFKEHAFVGIASGQYALIQHKTSLLLAEIAPVVRDLMYRQILTRFADFNVISLQPAVGLARLLAFHIRSLPEMGQGRISCEKCVSTLLDKRDMLGEYFSIGISGDSLDQAKLVSFPLIFPGVKPDMAHVPYFLYTIATGIDWSQEKPCLTGIASALADFYGFHWVPASNDETDAGGSQTENSEEKQDAQGKDGSVSTKSKNERREWLIQHVFFASLRVDYDPPQRFFVDNVVREITSTAKLYKIFERC